MSIFDDMKRQRRAIDDALRANENRVLRVADSAAGPSSVGAKLYLGLVTSMTTTTWDDETFELVAAEADLRLFRKQTDDGVWRCLRRVGKAYWASTQTLVVTEGEALLVYAFQINGVYYILPDCLLVPFDISEPPVITTSDEQDVAENTSGVCLTLECDDPNQDELEWVITGGADAALFTLDAETGELSFNSPPDYEDPDDAGANNTYVIVVKVFNCAGEESEELTITITVTDESE